MHSIDSIPVNSTKVCAIFEDPYENEWKICWNHATHSAVVQKNDNETFVYDSSCDTLVKIMMKLGYDLNNCCSLANVLGLPDNVEVSDIYNMNILNIPYCIFEVDLELY